MYDLSLIFPLYNEEARIHPLLDALETWSKQSQRRSEILFMSEGSSDSTNAIIASRLPQLIACNPSVDAYLIAREENQGKGGAIANGMTIAQGRHVVFADADLATPLSALEPLLQALEAGVDMAIGTRRAPRQFAIYGQPLRDILSYGLSCLVQLWVPGIRDSQCGFKAYQAGVAKQLVRKQLTFGYAFDIEHLYLARKLGMKVRQVLVPWRHQDGSRIRLTGTVLQILRDLVRIRWTHI